jgi:hypothetical protein
VSREPLRLFVVGGALIVAACASAPKPRPSTKRIASNAPAIVEGRVVDPEGRPAAGIGVRGIPRGEDIPWSPAAKTGCDGRFRLQVAAPAAYGFILSWRDVSVLTPRPDDPSLAAVPVEPGAHVENVVLVFDAAAWRRATDAAPAQTPSCP